MSSHLKGGLLDTRKRLVAGIVAAAIAVLLMVVYVSQVRAQEGAAREEALARYGGEQIDVCVAKRDILPGETLSSSNVTGAAWLASLLPADTITSLEVAQGRTVSSTILANEPISSSRLDEQDVMTVPEGLCAVSVPAQDVTAVGGAISVGNRLDVYVKTEKKVSLLGSSLLVLATNTSSSQSAKTSLSWVTLAVDPGSVQQLLTASSEDELFFVMPGGQEGVGTDG